MSGGIMAKPKISPEIIYKATDPVDISNVFDYVFELLLKE